MLIATFGDLASVVLPEETHGSSVVDVVVAAAWRLPILT